MNARSFAFILVLLHLIVSLPFIGIPDIGGSSEAREAHIVKIIYETGEWVLPLRNGIVPSKPPLFHWVNVIIAHALNISPDEFTVRFTSLLFGMGVLYLTIILAMNFSVPGKEKATGIVTAFILSTTYEFERMLQDARVDMLYSFFVVAAVYSILLPLTSRRNYVDPEFMRLSNSDYLKFFIFCAAGVLAKGPIGLVLPCVIVFTSLYFIQGLSGIRSLMLPRISWIIFLLIILPWYLLAAEKGGQLFIDRQIIFENLKRFFGGEDVNTESIWFYLASMLWKAFPWSFLFIGSLVFRGVATKIPEYGKKLCLAWFWSGFILLSLASGKRHSYLLPLYPALGICVALLIVSLFEYQRDYFKERVLRFWNLVGSGIAGFIMVAVLFLELLLLPYHLDNIVFEEAKWWITEHARFFQGILVGVLIVRYFIKKSLKGVEKSIGSWVAVCMLFSSVLCVGIGVKSHLKGYKENALKIKTLILDKKALFVVRGEDKEFFDVYMYYVGQEAKIIEERDFNGCNGEGYYLMKADVFDRMTEGVAANFNVLASVNELYDQLKGKKRRKVVVVECV